MTAAYVSASTFVDETGQWWHVTYDPDGTETSRTKTTEPPEPPPPPYTGPPVEESLAAAARIMLDLDTLTDTQIAEVASIYPEWTANTDVAVGAVYRRHGVVYKAIQAHPTQIGWEPPNVLALWTPVRQTGAGTPDEWVPPTGAQDAYQLGDRVTYDGQTWVSTAASNTWRPTEYGWTVEP